jgi:hypothetical protein
MEKEREEVSERENDRTRERGREREGGLSPAISNFDHGSV